MKKYDSTIARIAGNLLSGHPGLFMDEATDERIVRAAVRVAYVIVAETKRAAPPEEDK